ncbi:hypothetical protein ACJ41O_001420 [Fusarium nematophilum]
MDTYPEWARTRPSVWRSTCFKRLAAVISTIIFVCITIFLTQYFANFRLFIPTRPSDQPRVGSEQVSLDSTQIQAQNSWRKSLVHYNKLQDEKFTVALQTYHRPKELNKTLGALLNESIPSLHQVVVVWNDVDTEPPADYISDLGIPVRFRASEHNSLNEKLRPDPEFETQAVLLSDDDVYYHPKDLEFAFQTWRRLGPNKLTGALPRCSKFQKGSGYKYNFCSKKGDDITYNMIITNLAFTHVSFMGFYWSDTPVMKQIREYVDEHRNCEDIAFNFVHSYLSGEGPMLVYGKEHYVNMDPPKGISRKKGHLRARTKCLNDFVDIFGMMPLVDETEHVRRSGWL